MGSISKDIVYVCKKIKIIPYLCGGSALGTVRHHGFIPWDDDLDVAFFREDFEKFVFVFKNELAKKYILNAPNHSKNPKARFPKVIKKGTVFQEIGTVTTPGLNGVFVDIFIIDNVPNNYMIRFIKGSICNGMEFIAGCVYDFENLDVIVKSFYIQSNRKRYYLRKIIGRVASIIPSYKWYNAIDKETRWKDNRSDYCTLATGRKHYFGEMILRTAIFPPRFLSFEDMEAPVFHNVEMYLKNLYGDYMIIPSEDEREEHYIKALKL